MADEHGTGDSTGTSVEKYGSFKPASGTAVVESERVENPGFPPYRPRVADLDPAKERQQERRVSALFVVSIVGSIIAVVAYFLFPIIPGDVGSVRLNNLFLGVGITIWLTAKSN
jgi:ubiquinol-cytochrome c reductase iron-sulfur subunit